VGKAESIFSLPLPICPSFARKPRLTETRSQETLSLSPGGARFFEGVFLPGDSILKGLTAPLLSQACRTFLSLAYPEGEDAIPAAKRAYGRIAPDQCLEGLLGPPLCLPLKSEEGGIRGYAFRLGSSRFPHLKLQVIAQEEIGAWIFSVDTHDQMRLDPRHPDAAGWAQLQAINRELKTQIEHAWEADGLLTFNALLRRELAE
jgi:hypothetical protein